MVHSWQLCIWTVLNLLKCQKEAFEKLNGLIQICIIICYIYKKGNVADSKAQLDYQAFWFGLESRRITILSVSTNRGLSLTDSPVTTVFIYEIR